MRCRLAGEDAPTKVVEQRWNPEVVTTLMCGKYVRGIKLDGAALGMRGFGAVERDLFEICFPQMKYTRAEQFLRWQCYFYRFAFHL